MTILPGKYKTNFDIGIPSKKYFEKEVKNIVLCGKKVVSFQLKNTIQMMVINFLF